MLKFSYAYIRSYVHNTDLLWPDQKVIFCAHAHVRMHVHEQNEKCVKLCSCNMHVCQVEIDLYCAVCTRAMR